MTILDKVNVNVPKELIPHIEGFYGKGDIEQNVVLLSSIALFITKKVSFQRAAALSGFTQNDYIDILNSIGIAWMEYGEQEYLEEMEALKKLED